MNRAVLERLRRYVGGPALVIFAGAVVTGLTALLDGPKWLILIGVLIGAGGGLWASILGARSAEALRVKGDEVVELNRRIAATLTGGDSFCYLDTGLGDGMSANGTLVVVQEGDYPLYDVSVRIVDLNKLDAIKGPMTLNSMQHTDTVRSVGNMGAGQAELLGGFTVPPQGMRWNVFISARNGNLTERLRVRFVNGRWASAMDVTRQDASGEELLKERIDPDYPRDDHGSPVW